MGDGHHGIYTYGIYTLDHLLSYIVKLLQIYIYIIPATFITLVADYFLYSYEADFIHLQKKILEAKTYFNLTFCNIDDVLSLNNRKFNDCFDVIYPTLQILQIGLIIFIWSLMRIVNFSHDSMISIMTLISLHYIH